MKTRFDPKSAGCLLSAAALLAVSSPALADHDRYSSTRQAHYDYARVLNVDPIVRHVSVETPVRECWEERHERRYDHRGGAKAGNVIAGTIIGGVIGHQFGSGRGNDAMTVVGSLLGAAIAADNSDSGHRARGYRTESYPVERCDIRYETRTEERIDGYRVTYVYNGQTLTTRTNYDPGNRLKVRVSVRPVD